MAIIPTTNAEVLLQEIQGILQGVGSVNFARKNPCRVATAAVLPACTATSTVVLTGNANGALAAIDGITLVAGNRLLVKNQVAAKDNGIYEVTVLGTAGTPFVLTRTADAATNALVVCEMDLWIEEGTVNNGKIFRLTTANPIVVGTTALTFAAFSGGGGGGLTDANFVDNEVPAGVVDGVNAVFNLASAPTLGTEHLYTNGVRFTPTADYAMAGTQITYVSAPAVGSNLLADYRKP